MNRMVRTFVLVLTITAVTLCAGFSFPKAYTRDDLETIGQETQEKIAVHMQAFFDAYDEKNYELAYTEMMNCRNEAEVFIEQVKESRSRINKTDVELDNLHEEVILNMEYYSGLFGVVASDIKYEDRICWIYSAQISTLKNGYYDKLLTE